MWWLPLAVLLTAGAVTVSFMWAVRNAEAGRWWPLVLTDSTLAIFLFVTWGMATPLTITGLCTGGGLSVGYGLSLHPRRSERGPR